MKTITPSNRQVVPTNLNLGVESAFGVILTPQLAGKKGKITTATKKLTPVTATAKAPLGPSAPATGHPVESSESQQDNRKAALIGGVVAGLVLIAGYVCFSQLHSNVPSSEHIAAYYTVDDGKTTFAADSSNGPSFLKDGVPAVQAITFSRDGNKTSFVAYLERKNASGKMILGTRTVNVSKQSAYAPSVNDELSYEVKRPGDSKWVPLRSAEGMKIINVHSPEGPSGPTRVMP